MNGDEVYELEIEAGEGELDISLVAEDDDTLWLDYWTEYFDSILDDAIKMLSDYGEEDLLLSMAITVTFDLPEEIAVEYLIDQDHLNVNYHRKPSLTLLFGGLADRFFYGLDESSQELWLIESVEKTGNHNPRKLFADTFAAHFCEDKEMDDLVADLFYQSTDLEYIGEDLSHNPLISGRN